MDRLKCRKFRFWSLFARVVQLGAVILISNAGDLGLQQDRACAGSDGWPLRVVKSNHVMVREDDQVVPIGP